MKKVVVITGSPRKQGNSDLMADAFIKGAGKNGHEVMKIAAAELKIHGCRACQGCYSTGNPCIFSDGFNSIAPSLEAADVIVFATPLYWFSFSEQIKAVIDRFYAFMGGKGKLKGSKECVLIATGEGDEEDFAGLCKSYELMTQYLEWHDLGQIIVPHVNDKGAVKDTGALAEAEKLGQTL